MRNNLPDINIRKGRSIYMNESRNEITSLSIIEPEVKELEIKTARQLSVGLSLIEKWVDESAITFSLPRLKNLSCD